MINIETKLTCPHCGCQARLQSFQGNEEILEIAKLASRMGRNWDWVREYLDCFRSSPERPLKPARMRILVGELLEFVEKRGFYLERKWQSIRPDALFAALRQVALLNKCGFRNHRYLMKVAVGENLKLIQGEEKAQERLAEEAMRRGRDHDGPEQIKKILGTLNQK